MKSPSAISAMKSGISLSFLRMHLEHNFNIPAPLVEQCLETYRLLYWHPNHFFKFISNGIIVCKELVGFKNYQIRYHKCTLSDIRNCNQVALSFRSPKAEYPACNYVLVMPGNEGDKV